MSLVWRASSGTRATAAAVASTAVTIHGVHEFDYHLGAVIVLFDEHAEVRAEVRPRLHPRRMGAAIAGERRLPVEAGNHIVGSHLQTLGPVLLALSNGRRNPNMSQQPLRLIF